jgi:N-acetylglucosamine-6-phosphate deacetylase
MILQSTRVWIAEQWLAAQIEVVEGKIVRIYPYATMPVDVDYQTQRILPGFIDTHIHGSHGEDTNLCDEEGLIRFANTLLQEGVTGFCPTTVTQSESVLLRALKNVAKVHETQREGAQILGVHFEGPYLNVKYKGAQPEAYIVASNVEQFKVFQQASGNLIRIITLAPEHDHEYALCRYASSQGITVNIGHSAASYEQTLLAVANGAKSMTHAFNAMSPLNHREPGVAGAMLRLGSVYAEVITDGNHVVWPVINLLFKAKGKDHVIMITDALSAKGMPEGFFDLGGQMVDIRSNGSAYIHQTDTLAGSTLKTNLGLRNLIEKAYVDEVSAINACTINPAKVIGYADRKGLIQVHYDADLVVLCDDYTVAATYIKGQKVYQV